MTERWTARQVAEYLGVKPRTFLAWVYRGKAPAPDGHEELSRMPWWWPATVRAWNASRPGRGTRTDLHGSAVSRLS